MKDDNIPRQDAENDYELSDDYAEDFAPIVIKETAKPAPQKIKAVKRQDKAKTEKRKNAFWVARIFIITLVMSAVFLVITESVMAKKNLVLSFCILFVLLAINILFDMVGTAAASADIEPFISKASRKDKRAVVALKLLKNAERVTSFCNDVVGDICGIVSGGCASAIVIILVSGTTVNNFVLSVIFSAVISSLTVGGKAIGKIIGMKNSHKIIMNVAAILAVFKKK